MVDKKDFKYIVNCIFINKNKYKEITSKEKESSFFIINRKFSIKYPKIANFFNNKNIDKSLSIDKWFDFFKNYNNIPFWYWSNKKSKTKINLKQSDLNLLKERLNISEHDINFLYKYYNKDIVSYLKKIKKY
jgi:hypothetical protein